MKQLILILFSVNLFIGSVCAQVKLITGQPTAEIPLFSIKNKCGNSYGVMFVYDGEGVIFSGESNNSVARMSWCGLGWNYRIPYIKVDHNSTVSIEDDRWYYYNEAGSIDEVIRITESGVDKFYLKHDPYAKITPHYYMFSEGFNAIDGWEIVRKNGEISRFGEMGVTPTSPEKSSNRAIPCGITSKMIGIAPSGGTAAKFTYQWDLREIEDTKGGKFSFEYQQSYRTVNGYSYCGESYVSTINSDDGSRLNFTTSDKPIDERRLLKDCIEREFDFYETKILRSVSKIETARSETVNFEYTIQLNNGVQGFQKSCLNSIKSVENLNNNYLFTYQSDGLLGKIENVKTGASTEYTYSYEYVRTNKIDTFKISFPTANFNTSNIYNVGAHVFCIDTGSGNVTRLEIIDHAALRLIKTNIPGITGVDLNNTRCYIGDDFFVLVKALKTGADTTAHEIKLFEYIDRQWVPSNGYGTNGTKQLALKHKTFVYADRNTFAIHEEKRSIAYVYHKIKNIWVSTLNAKGGNDIDIDGNHDTEGNGYNFSDQEKLNFKRYGFVSMENTLSRGYLWKPRIWNYESYMQGAFLPFLPGTKLLNNNLKIKLLDKSTIFYNNANQELFSLPNPDLNIRMRSFNNITGEWYPASAGCLQNNGANEKCFWGNDYVIYMEPDRWTKVEKLSQNGTTFQTTYIKPTNGIDVWQADLNHMCNSANTTAPRYSKVFDYDVDTVYTYNNYFVAINRENNFVWVFRWNDALQLWESLINGYERSIKYTYEWDDNTADWKYIIGHVPASNERDSKGQGCRFPFSIKDVFLFNNKLGIWYGENSTDSCLAIAQYDELNGGYGGYPFGFQIRYFKNKPKKVKLADDKIIELCNGNGTQTVRIMREYQKRFTILARAKVVNAVIESGGGNTNVRKTFQYVADADFNVLDYRNGIPYYKQVKTTLAEGNAGSIVYNFECDSTNGLFGKLLHMENRNEQDLVITSDKNFWDTYEISLPNQRKLAVPLLLRRENNIEGVRKNQMWPVEYFNGDIKTGNGEFEVNLEIDNNGDGLVMKREYAYKNDSRMANKNLLLQQAGEITYHVPNIELLYWKNENIVAVPHNTTEYVNIAFNSVNLNVGDQVQSYFAIKISNDYNALVGLKYRFNYAGGTTKLTSERLLNISKHAEPTFKYTLASTDNPEQIRSVDLVLIPYGRAFDASNFDAQVIRELSRLTQNDYAIRGGAQTWDWYNSRFVPKSSYAWVVPMGSNGRPVTGYTFQPFNYENISANVNWKLMNTVEQYDVLSTPLEIKNGKGTSNSVVYRNDIHLSIGTIANSKYDECAIFTCDYDINESGFFDVQNKWKHYNNTTFPSGAICAVESILPPSRLHFGEKCLHVKNCQAAAKTVAVHSKTAKMTWSAWVRPLEDKPIRFAACLVENGVGNHNVFYDYEYNNPKGLKNDGTWQFVKFNIDISKPVSGTLPPTFDGNDGDGIYVWVGNHPGDPVSDFYIEDIRIYPSKSLVTTTYYDSKWQQPVITVDANGNPSQKVEYDDFGRPVRWYKIDKKTANLTLLQQKKYHLMGDFYVPPNPNKWYKIVPEKNESFCIDIKDASWTDGYTVHLWKYVGTLNQIWKFVPDGSNYKIESKGGGGTTFRLSVPDLNNNTALMIKSTTGGTQLWKLTDAGDGFCRISASTDDGKYIDLEQNDAKYGGKVQIYNGGLFSKWQLVEVQ
ncbi:MAG: RICIN domain-containing protein [Bacteroidales bacterium]|nr:RICIN domain-containing protein [Bacteroidales bacterium]